MKAGRRGYTAVSLFLLEFVYSEQVIELIFAPPGGSYDIYDRYGSGSNGIMRS